MKQNLCKSSINISPCLLICFFKTRKPDNDSHHYIFCVLPFLSLRECWAPPCLWYGLGIAGVQRDVGNGIPLVSYQLTSCTHAQNTLCQPREFKTLGSLRNHHFFKKNSQASVLKCLNLEPSSHTEAPGKPSGQGRQLSETLFWISLQPSVVFFTQAKEHLSSYPPRCLQEAQLLPGAALALQRPARPVRHPLRASVYSAVNWKQ